MGERAIKTAIKQGKSAGLRGLVPANQRPPPGARSSRLPRHLPTGRCLPECLPFSLSPSVPPTDLRDSTARELQEPSSDPSASASIPSDQTPQQDGRGIRPLLGHFWGQEPTTPKALCSNCRDAGGAGYTAAAGTRRGNAAHAHWRHCTCSGARACVRQSQGAGQGERLSGALYRLRLSLPCGRGGVRDAGCYTAAAETWWGTPRTRTGDAHAHGRRARARETLHVLGRRCTCSGDAARAQRPLRARGARGRGELGTVRLSSAHYRPRLSLLFDRGENLKGPVSVSVRRQEG
uniref:Uncharacterized protein n=1 Tax=Rangifer tarandus platyrhynchus TaxID=3082113 RepID=A0ACB0ES53_RANTA|nr:unnamed protein product [Rangifer tarandus platyrhynchus]